MNSVTNFFFFVTNRLCPLSIHNSEIFFSMTLQVNLLVLFLCINFFTNKTLNRFVLFIGSKYHHGDIPNNRWAVSKYSLYYIIVVGIPRYYVQGSLKLLISKHFNILIVTSNYDMHKSLFWSNSPLFSVIDIRFVKWWRVCRRI